VTRADTGQIWTEGAPIPSDLSFACSAVEVFRANHAMCVPCTVVIRSDDAFQGSKRGYGSSASVVVAVTGGLYAAHHGTLSQNDVLKSALAAHRAAQGGMGSGTDVATSVVGDLVHWRPALIAGAHAEAVEACAVAWPEGLHMIAGYSGASASTQGHLQALKARAQENETALVDELRSLGQTAEHLIGAFRHAAVNDILEGVSGCHRALDKWDKKHGFGIMTPAIQEMVRIAESLQVVAKVSGAGGGDSILAFSDDPSRLNSLVEQWTSAGYIPTPIHRHSQGVMMVEELPD